MAKILTDLPKTNFKLINKEIKGTVFSTNRSKKKIHLGDNLKTATMISKGIRLMLNRTCITKMKNLIKILIMATQSLKVAKLLKQMITKIIIIKINTNKSNPINIKNMISFMISF